jgi:MFS family permease
MMTAGPSIVVPARKPAKPRAVPAIDATEGGAAARLPTRDRAPEPDGVGTAAVPRPHEEPRHGARRVIRTRRFWILFAGAATIGMFDEGVLQAFVPNAIKAGIAADAAAFALAMQSLAYVFGQVIGGWLSDRIGRRAIGITSGVLVFAGVVLAIWAAPRGFAFALAGITLHGAATGAIIAVRSAAFHDVFGGAGFGTVFGILAVAYPVGGTVAVYIGAISIDRFGSFFPLVPVLGVAVVTWCIALWAAGPFRHRAHRARSGPAG